MPFLPLQDNSLEHDGSADFARLVLRGLAFASYAYYQLAADLRGSFGLIWEKQPWDLADQLGALGLPYAAVLAPLAVLVLAAALLGILLGFFCRFNAVLFTLAMGFVLVSGLRVSAALNPQSLVLYLTLGLALTIAGAGRFSLDHLFAGRRARRSGARDATKTRRNSP